MKTLPGEDTPWPNPRFRAVVRARFGSSSGQAKRARRDHAPGSGKSVREQSVIGVVPVERQVSEPERIALAHAARLYSLALPCTVGVARRGPRGRRGVPDPGRPVLRSAPPVAHARGPRPRRTVLGRAGLGTHIGIDIHGTRHGERAAARDAGPSYINTKSYSQSCKNGRETPHPSPTGAHSPPHVIVNKSGHLTLRSTRYATRASTVIASVTTHML